MYILFNNVLAKPSYLYPFTSLHFNYNINFVNIAHYFGTD